MNRRALNPHDTAWTYAAITLGLAATALIAIAHTLGWHRYCDHRHRWHNYPGPPGGTT